MESSTGYNLPMSSPRPNERVQKSNKKSMLIVASLLVVAAAVATTIGVVSMSKSDAPKDLSAQQAAMTKKAEDAGVPANFLDYVVGRGYYKKLDLNVDISQFVIPASSLNKPFLVHAVYDKGASPNGKLQGATRGWFANTNEHIVFHFELSEDKKDLYIVREDYVTRTTDEQMKYSKDRSVWPGYVATIRILNKDPNMFAFSARTMIQNGFFMSQQHPTFDYTIVEAESKSHAENTNFLINYQDPKTEGTFALYFSIVKLSSDVMPARAADNRVGYFSSRYTDLGTHKRTTARESDDVDRQVTFIHRHRLENDKNGNVKKQIVYYIDPSVPERYRQTFKEGVEYWQPAFEKAGFKNAIRAVIPGDADWPADYHLGDLRYNTISFVVSERIVAVGPSVVDPRSGEIIHTDITFGHGWLKHWVRGFEISVPKKPVSAAAKKSNMRAAQCHIAEGSEIEEQTDVIRALTADSNGRIPKAIINDAFREVVMHEVGHTLGLRHNFYGTVERTPAQLQDNKYMKKHGASSSVMDYFGANIWSSIAKTDENTHQFYQDVLGEYDVAAIVYGYKEIKGEESTYKNKELLDLAAAAPTFLTDEDVSADLNGQNPYGQKYDMSSDPIYYYNDQMKLQKILRKNIVERSIRDGESWTKFWSMERIYIRRLGIYSRNAALFIGGTNITHVHYSAGESVLKIPVVSEAHQNAALKLMGKIVEAKDGIFPSPDTFSQYVEEVGYECKDSVTSYCLSVKVADVDGLIESIRISAVKDMLNAAAIKRLIVQDRKAKLSVSNLVKAALKSSFEPSVYSHDMNVRKAFITQCAILSSAYDNRISGPASAGISGALTQLKSLKKTVPASMVGEVEVVQQYASKILSGKIKIGAEGKILK